MNNQNKRKFIIIGLFAVIFAILNLVGKKKQTVEKLEIADEDGRELNLRMPEESEAYENEVAPAPRAVFDYVPCKDLHRQACQIEYDELLDDSTGIYNPKTGYNHLGVVDRGKFDLVTTAKAFWEGYSQFSVNKEPCMKIFEDHRVHLRKKYYPSECADALKICKGKESCRVQVEASCLWAAEASFKQYLDDEGDLEIDRFLRLNHCRDQYYRQIYDKYYRDHTNDISRIFNEAILLARDVIVREFPEDRDQFFGRVETTRLLLGERLLWEGLAKDEKHVFDSEGEIFIRNIVNMDNAFFGEAETFNVASLGMSIVVRFHSKAALLFIIGHELGHAFDPLRFAIESCGYRGRSFNENKSLNPLNLPNALNCSGVPVSLRKKAKELLAVLPLSRYQKVIDGQTRPASYLGEIFADWFGTQLLKAYFKQKGISTSYQRRFLYNISRFVCGSDAQVDDGIHPPWADRVNIFLRYTLDHADELYQCPKSWKPPESQIKFEELSSK